LFDAAEIADLKWGRTPQHQPLLFYGVSFLLKSMNLAVLADF
jgi:hypothetical protein